ncbi:MAG: hypothetical protein GX493_06055 [Firmicutes bacterium]|nr:hypothetical protein [Bacillota bacterium]
MGYPPDRFCLIGFLAMWLVGPGFPPVSAACGAPKIAWQKPFVVDGLTIIPGSVRSAHGTFAFRWVIDRDGGARLTTTVPFGAGELPPREIDLFPLIRKDGMTLLFQEWFPLVNVREPSTIRIVAKVATAELFSVLPTGQHLPAENISKKRQAIAWGTRQERDGIEYLPGRVETSLGSMEIVWKKEPGHLPELVLSEPPKAEGLPPGEVRLYPWMEGAIDTTFVFRKAPPRVDGASIMRLQYLVTVRTTELLAGFGWLYQ